ncbi:MAG: YwaF family protein [Mycobacteriales bacterium]
MEDRVTGTPTPIAYGLCAGLGALACAALCWGARRRPGPWVRTAGRILGAGLLVDAITWMVGEALAGTWTAAASLPLALCDVALIVAAVACWAPAPVLVELTYFWGLAGTLQAVLTPDLTAGFPHLMFFEYVVAHLGIVTAALFLVAGRGLTPRPGAVRRVYLITLGYTAFVGLVDALTGADYMFLRSSPRTWTLLRVLGPWPWYVATAAVVALALLVGLDTPFRRARRHGVRQSRPLRHRVA